jgi:hypothetical protein
VCLETKRRRRKTEHNEDENRMAIKSRKGNRRRGIQRRKGRKKKRGKKI